MDKLPDYSLEPPEVLMDPMDPANDQYFKRLDQIQAHVVQISSKMRPKHVKVAKALHQGKRPKDIAEEVGLAPGTVSGLSKKPHVQALVGALRHLSHHMDGPSVELRKNMLWRIAHRGEVEDPGVTIQAVKELNKMDGVYPEANASQNTPINITINNEALPRTKLDVAHDA